MAEQSAATGTTDTRTAAAAGGTDASTTTTDKGVAATSTATAVTPDTKADVKTDAQKAYWPEDWQKRLAGEDEKALKQVSRYASPEEVWKKARSLEQRLSSGEFRAAKPKDANEKELAAWRKDNGIPDKPEAYDLKGIEVPDYEKPYVDNFLKAAHAADYTPEQTKTAISAYLQNQKAAQEARYELDEKQSGEARDNLAEEYGKQFSRNKNIVNNLLTKFPESVRNDLLNARMPDGRLLFNVPDVFRTLLNIELMNNPAGVVVPSSGGDLGKSMIDRYNEIQKYMRDNRSAYNKDSNVQAEYRQVVEGLIKNGLMDESGNLKKAA